MFKKILIGGITVAAGAFIVAVAKEVWDSYQLDALKRDEALAVDEDEILDDEEDSEKSEEDGDVSEKFQNDEE